MCAGIPSEDVDGIPLSPEQSSLLSRLSAATEAAQDGTGSTSTGDMGLEGLEYMGQALVLSEQGKWKEAGELATKGTCTLYLM